MNEPERLHDTNRKLDDDACTIPDPNDPVMRRIREAVRKYEKAILREMKENENLGVRGIYESQVLVIVLASLSAVNGVKLALLVALVITPVASGALAGWAQQPGA